MVRVVEVYHVPQGRSETLATVVVIIDKANARVVVHTADEEPKVEEFDSHLQARLFARELATNLRRYGR
jgi:hypothetical protein